MKIETPLVFVVGKNHHIKTIRAVRLGGDFYGLVCNRVFLKRRNAEECRVLVAHELARIAQRHCHTPKLAKKIWFGAVLTIIASVFVLHAYKTIKSSEQLKKKCKDFLSPFVTFVKDNWWWYAGSTLLVVGSKVAAEFIGAYLSRKYQHEADLLALKGFGGDPDAYLDMVRALETQEEAYRQKMQYQYKSHYAYIAGKIDALTETVHPYIICFLKNELGRRAIKEVSRPAVSERTTSLLNLESSLDDRIAYISENLSSQKETKP
jgi:Zn-dependent protease with chaperone function